MSRRKQAKPQHIDSEEPASGGNGEFHARQKVRLAETKKSKVDEWVSATPLRAAAAVQRKLWGFCRTLTCWCRLELTGRNDFKRNAGVWDKDSLLKWHTLAQFTSRDGRDESNLICDFVVGTDGLISTLVSQPISLKMEEKKTRAFIYSTIHLNCWLSEGFGKWIVLLISQEIFLFSVGLVFLFISHLRVPLGFFEVVVVTLIDDIVIICFSACNYNI